jgi:hypothetical protein
MSGTSHARNLAPQSEDAAKAQLTDPVTRKTLLSGTRRDGDEWNLFGPEIILPVQYAPPKDAEGRCEGERRLMLAVLEDAVVTLKLHLRAPSVHSRRIIAELENWLASGSRAHTFAFATICDVLGFDVSAVRAAIRQWTQAERADPRYRRIHAGPGRHQIGLAQRVRR